MFYRMITPLTKYSNERVESNDSFRKGPYILMSQSAFVFHYGNAISKIRSTLFSTEVLSLLILCSDHTYTLVAIKVAQTWQAITFPYMVISIFRFRRVLRHVHPCLRLLIDLQQGLKKDLATLEPSDLSSGWHISHDCVIIECMNYSLQVKPVFFILTASQLSARNNSICIAWNSTHLSNDFDLWFVRLGTIVLPTTATKHSRILLG